MMSPAANADTVPLKVFLMVLASAIFHALWNLAAKKVSGHLGVMWLGMVFSMGIFCPLAIVEAVSDTDVFVESLEEGWLYIFITGVVHAFYMLSLGLAYRVGDLSLVYPVARGSGVVFTACFSVPILGERISLTKGVGIGLVVFGIGITPLWSAKAKAAITSVDSPGGSATAADDAAANVEKSGLASHSQNESDYEPVPVVFGREDSAVKVAAGSRDLKEAAPSTSCFHGVGMALLVGVSISTYSLDDKVGTEIVRPFTYMSGMILVELVFVTPLLWFREQALVREAMSSLKQYALGVGCGASFTYLVILYAYQLSNVSYVVAMRESSVFFAAIFGFVFLHEVPTLAKVIGAGLIVVGVIVVKFM